MIFKRENLSISCFILLLSEYTKLFNFFGVTSTIKSAKLKRTLYKTQCNVWPSRRHCYNFTMQFSNKNVIRLYDAILLFLFSLLKLLHAYQELKKSIEELTCEVLI